MVYDRVGDEDQHLKHLVLEGIVNQVLLESIDYFKFQFTQIKKTMLKDLNVKDITYQTL